MPCDTKLQEGQTIAERKEEVRKTVETVAQALAAGTVRAVVSKEGAIAFAGLTEGARNRVTDACIYRRIMVSGGALAKAAIAKAEAIAGKPVNRQVIGQGAHSHDGGRTWHDHKG
jgi:hypothetical protein